MPTWLYILAHVVYYGGIVALAMHAGGLVVGRAAREQIKALKTSLASAATEVAHLVESKDRLADELRSARASRDTAVNLLDAERTRREAAEHAHASAD